MRLTYELAADASQVKRVLRGVEAEAKASNRRMARDAQTSVASVSRRASTSADARAGQRAQEQAEKQRSRAALQNIKTEERERLRSAKAIAGAQESLDRQRSRALLAQHREGEREQRRALSASARAVQRVRGGAASGIGSAIGTVGRFGGAALGLAGGFGAAAALDEQLSIKRGASKLAISGGAPDQKRQLEQESLGVKGFTGTETLGAMSGFVEKTGNLGAARALIQDIGKLSLATSADFAEMGVAAGQAFNVIKDTIQDPKKQIEAVNDVMRTLAAQGNLGAVEIKDMATELAGLGAATRKFDGGPVELLKTVGAMAQASVARGGAASAPEATTAVTRFAQDIVQNQGKFAAADIDVFKKGSGNTKLRGPEDIMLDVLSKTGGDLTKINDMFGVFAERAVGGFSPLFVDAEKQKKGSGRAAVKAEFDRFQKAGLSDAQVNERAGLRMSDDDIKMKEAAKIFNAAVGDQLAPVASGLAKSFADMAPQVGGVTKALGKFVSYVVNNPFEGIGLLVGGKIAKDLAGAGLGNIISGEITGKLGAAFSAAGVGLSVATMIVTANVLNFEKREADIKAGGKDVLLAQQLAAKGDVGGVQEVLDRRREAADKANDPGVLASILGVVAKGAMLAGPVGWAVAAAGGWKGADQAGVKASDALTDQNREVASKSLAGFVEELERAREAAIKMQGEMNKVKAPGGPEANRTAPVSSPSRG